jgi:DNA-binding MarR family transcriptional regulator
MGSEELVERLSRVTDCLAMQLRIASDQDWPDIELTMPQLRTLVLLYRGPQRMGEIAAALGISLPATTNMVVRLEAKGLVERVHDQDDRRVVICSLTREGRRQSEALWNVHRQQIAAVADILTSEEMARVVAAMELLSAALRRHLGRTDVPAPASPDTIDADTSSR